MPSLQSDQTDKQFNDGASYHFYNSFKVYCALVLPINYLSQIFLILTEGLSALQEGVTYYSLHKFQPKDR